jgi:hypothetical protein
MTNRTLHLTKSSYRTLTLALLVLGVLIGFAEIVLRQQAVQSLLTAPSLNSRHRQFEVQWHRLETLTKSGKKVSCIVLGSSMVWRGFDPLAYENGFESQTGDELICFNFGVDGLTPLTAGVLSKILVEAYHPNLLIYGTSARDYAVPQDAENNAVILEMAWIQYRLGEFNFEGWLIEHSFLYRYRRHINDLLHVFTRDALPEKSATISNRYGFDPDDTVGDSVRFPPNSDHDDYLVQSYFRLLRDYSMRQENIAGFDDLLSQKDNGTTVVVVEMPVPQTYFYFFGNGVIGYQKFLDLILSATRTNQIIFLRTSCFNSIPDDGWVDYAHLNTKGASIFSESLGIKVGALMENQINCLDG